MSESTKFDSFKLNRNLSNLRLKQSKIRLRFKQGGEGVSKEICGTVRLPVCRHVSRQ